MAEPRPRRKVEDQKFAWESSESSSSSFVSCRPAASRRCCRSGRGRVAIGLPLLLLLVPLH